MKYLDIFGDELMKPNFEQSEILPFETGKKIVARFSFQSFDYCRDITIIRKCDLVDNNLCRWITWLQSECNL